MLSHLVSNTVQYGRWEMGPCVCLVPPDQAPAEHPHRPTTNPSFGAPPKPQPFQPASPPRGARSPAEAAGASETDVRKAGAEAQPLIREFLNPRWEQHGAHRSRILPLPPPQQIAPVRS